ncbi:hypothetical protein KFU94_63035 [Chloroflexi bacterium TSY]|nr:hypothetical protein [Chloroflexi bacterium TSY]
MDNQVKLRGYRIELGEIEAVLSQHADVREAVVATQEMSLGNKRLVAYVVPTDKTTNAFRSKEISGETLGRNGQQVPHEDPVAAAVPPSSTLTANLRSYLESTLPDYMIPSAFVILDQLPLTPSGKVDRRALPAPGTDRPDLEIAFVAPSTLLEAQVAAIWSELLGVDRVGIHDNFFELGGHSLISVRLIGQIEKQFGLKMPLKKFFRNPTVAQLAALLDPDQATGVDVTSKRRSGPPTGSHGLSVPQGQTETVDDLYDQLERPSASRHSKNLLRMGWHRRRIWASVAANWIPYPWAFRLLDWSLRYHSMQHLLFRYYVGQIRRFLAVIESGLDEREVVQRSLFYGSLYHYQIGPWGRMPSEKAQQRRYANQVRTEGFELLEKTVAQKKGVLLVLCHDNVVSWLSLIGARWSRDAAVQGYGIGGAHLYVQQMGLDSEILENTLFSQQLNTARRTLQEGGIVTIAGDGHHGRSAGLEYDFHGRRRPFRTSFAELALMTGAAVFVLVNRIDADGRIQARLVGPLEVGDGTVDHDVRIRMLVDQYVALLHKVWAEEPWMVPWFQMEKHLAYPPIQRVRPIFGGFVESN